MTKLSIFLLNNDELEFSILMFSSLDDDFLWWILQFLSFYTENFMEGEISMLPVTIFTNYGSNARGYPKKSKLKPRSKSLCLEMKNTFSRLKHFPAVIWKKKKKN